MLVDYVHLQLNQSEWAVEDADILQQLRPFLQFLVLYTSEYLNWTVVKDEIFDALTPEQVMSMDSELETGDLLAASTCGNDAAQGPMKADDQLVSALISLQKNIILNIHLQHYDDFTTLLDMYSVDANESRASGFTEFITQLITTHVCVESHTCHQ